MFTREHAKDELKRKGWSYRAAAGRLGRTYQHVSEVLNGHRQSARLINEIIALPLNQKPATRPARAVASAARAARPVRTKGGK